MEPDAKTILIVDDDHEIRRLVGEFLSREGFEVVSAQDGRDMDSALERVQPDLFILDLMLPGEDGLSICRRLRAQGNTPILMLTTESTEHMQKEGMEKGASAWIVKPFNEEQLLAGIAHFLGTP